MCLISVTKRHDPPDLKERWAWKWLGRDSGGRLVTPIYGKIVKPDTWMKAKLVPVSIYGRFGIVPKGEYTSGFHVFRTKKAAMAYWETADPSNLIRVRVRGVRTEGSEWDGEMVSVPAPCLVADEMFVPAQ